MRCLFALALALTLASTAAPDAHAQTDRTPPTVRRGFWAEAGGGSGGVWVGCGNCTEVLAAFGPNAFVRAGGAFSDRVFWGLEVMGLPESRGGPDPGTTTQPRDSTMHVATLNVAPVVLWYPWRGGIFLKGGVGVAHSTVRMQAPGTTTFVTGRGTASSVTLGAGYDVPLLRRVALTTQFSAHIGAVGDAREGTATIDDILTSLYSVSLGLTLR